MSYTGIVVFAALGFETLFRMLKNRNAHIAIYSLLVIGLVLPTVFIAKSFPVSYVYFNEFAGGLDEAYGNYQIDYYAASAKPAADWMAKNIPVKDSEIVVSNNPWELNMCWDALKNKRQSTYIRFRERNEQNWDYAVFLPQFVDPNMMRKHYFPPKGTIYEVKIDNSVIACVVKRENKSDYLGIEAVKKNDFQNGIRLLEDAVRYDQFNEIAWTYLGIAYASTGRMQDATAALTNALNISPEYQLPQYYYQQISGMGRR
jgi:tetratricopeptide (TPR) repeat protein